jgi:hypothetical protein
MASPYDKMTLADLRAAIMQQMDNLTGMVGGGAGPVAESNPEPAEPPVTSLPLPAARAQAAKTASIQGIK